MNISRDISGKVDRETVEVLAAIDSHAGASSTAYFLIGAAARDIIFSGLYNIPSGRTTFDIDLAVQLASWDEYHQLFARLIESGDFHPDKRMSHRLIHKEGTPVDIVPFGEIAEAQVLHWPPEGSISMSVLAFKEAHEHSLVVRLRSHPPLDVHVCAPSALALLKLLAWADQPHSRGKDAVDLQLLLSRYLDVGNFDRLSGPERDIVQQPGFDYEKAGAQLLGRDAAKIISGKLREKVLSLLNQECDDDGNLSLARAMVTVSLHDEERVLRNLRLLQALRTGIFERSPA